MAQHIELGKLGEQMAVDYLLERDYSILHRNYRYLKYEIDIIAFKDAVLHFVEVKLRSSKDFGPPEEKVTKKKFRDLCKAADNFLYDHRQFKDIQFDILSITTPKDAETEYFFIEDVYL